MSKTWKDTLPGVDAEHADLQTAVAYLAEALRTTIDHHRPEYAAIAAAQIRAVRKRLGLKSRQVPDVMLTGDALLWVAMRNVTYAATALPHHAAEHLRVAEACLRTYWKQAQR